jgi:dipeptidase D
MITMHSLERLQPKEVFAFFEDLCEIPHGSGNTKDISDYCVAFAQMHGLQHYQDKSNNIIIIKPATPGHEQAAPLILQGHLDMVCEKAPNCTRDMEKDGLDLVVDGDALYAKGTTLGGDDGIGVAIGLAVLADRNLIHPRLEAVFTVDEEIGMLGAAALDLSPLQGHTLLNLDSETEGVFTVSCAGGNTTTCTLPVKRENWEGTCLRLEIKGLKGGHSGTEINKGRANANQLMGRLLDRLTRTTPLRLIAVEGGKKDNAIPTSSTALVTAKDEQALRYLSTALLESFHHEYLATDPDISITVSKARSGLLPMDNASSSKAICFLLCAPSGVQAMSLDIPDLVQTSLNMGILNTDEKEMVAFFSVRSSIGSQKQMVTAKLSNLIKQLGGSAIVKADYPGWEYKKESPLRDLMVKVYKEQYGKDPKIEAIHAGLECGLFLGKRPNLDCVSVGPNLQDIHTCHEQVSIASVQRVWNFVTEVIRQWAAC